jgi:hypothetical protein
MRSVKRGRWGGVLLLGCCLLAHSANAGGPIIFNEEFVDGCALSEEDGCALPWLDNRAVYVVETGKLGVIENDVARARVAQAFQRWTAVPTASLQVVNLEDIQDTLPPGALTPFLTDIDNEDFTMIACTVPGLNGGNPFLLPRLFCDAFNACFAQGFRNCPSPVVFDEDGSITADVFGDGNTVGFSGPLLFSTPGDPVAPFRILQAFTVLNGAFFDNNSQNNPGFDDPEGKLFLDTLMTHEFGHFLGLDHSSLNGDTALLNPAVSILGSTGTTMPPATIGQVDLLAAVSAAETETMYPILLTGPDGVSPLDTPELDDQVALSTLYPASTFAATGTIAGHVFFPDGTNAQGITVIARRIDANDNVSVLKGAASQLTGNTFAPRRCTGPLFFDGDRDGDPDNDGDNVLDDNNPLFLNGLFGSCSTPDFAGFQECAVQLNNNFLGRGENSFFFLGQCGFPSLGFSAPRPVGEEAESRFVLKGLTPGKYLIQAASVLVGTFSPPVLTFFNLSAAPSIFSNDNIDFAFSPNPQVGEFYNGEKEAGNASDNPFAYTPVEISAGGRVDNVNIVLNTAPSRAAFNSDPGFDFCGLGDVNKDGTVDKIDIFTVVQEEEKSEKKQSFDPRADLNEDGSVTFLDVDIITDLATVPNLTFGSNDVTIRRRELKRSLAPFSAICTAARQGGCTIQAPVETIQENGTPNSEVCNVAAGIGCQVIGCP